MAASKLFQKALDIPRVQEILGDLDDEMKILRLQMCYHCIGRDVMETVRKEDQTEVSPIEALLVSLELFHSGDFEFVEDEEGIIRAVKSVPK